MNRTKKLVSLACTLALGMSLTVPALAAERTIYLDGYSFQDGEAGVWGTVESTKEASQLSVKGDLELYQTLTYDDGSVAPIYITDSPVTVELTDGMTREEEEAEDWTHKAILTLQIDEMSVDENNQLNLKKENAVYFDGNMSAWIYDEQTNEEWLELCTIKEYYENSWDEFGWPNFYRGAKATLSEPGIYHVFARFEALAGACEVYVIVEEGEEQPSTGFADVASDAWYAKQVAWAVENGITGGTSATTFSPDQTCTTAQILTFLWRAAGSPEATIANPFTDVTEADYFFKPAVWAYEKGLVSGTALNGNTPCTRSATVTYLWKLAGAPETKAPAFEDVAANADYAQAVQWAVENGVTGGISATQFGPANTCTRAQIVTFLYADFAK